jgi:hypothetical protein
LPKAKPSKGHENAGIATRSVLIAAAVLFLATAVVAVGLYAFLQAGLMPHQARIAAQPAPIPPAPRLQSHAPDDLAVWRSQKESLLDSYGWSDPGHNAARIPIDRGMALYVQQQRSRSGR